MRRISNGCSCRRTVPPCRSGARASARPARTTRSAASRRRPSRHPWCVFNDAATVPVFESGECNVRHTIPSYRARINSREWDSPQARTTGFRAATAERPICRRTILPVSHLHVTSGHLGCIEAPARAAHSSAMAPGRSNHEGPRRAPTVTRSASFIGRIRRLRDRRVLRGHLMLPRRCGGRRRSGASHCHPDIRRARRAERSRARSRRRGGDSRGRRSRCDLGQLRRRVRPARRQSLPVRRWPRMSSRSVSSACRRISQRRTS